LEEGEEYTVKCKCSYGNGFHGGYLQIGNEQVCTNKEKMTETITAKKGFHTDPITGTYSNSGITAKFWYEEWQYFPDQHFLRGAQVKEYDLSLRSKDKISHDSGISGLNIIVEEAYPMITYFDGTMSN